MLKAVDREVVGDLLLSRQGLELVQELVDKFGARFGGTREEWEAAGWLGDQMTGYGLQVAWEEFTCPGWTRGPISLQVTAPVERDVDCIALPYCPPGTVEAPLVYLGDGHPDTYREHRERIPGAIVMVTTATPRFYHRTMHRGEKLGRALEAGAAGFIWMRGEPGGLPETGSARFGGGCDIPAISVSYEVGHELVRLGGAEPITVRITSDCKIHDVTSRNVVGQLAGTGDLPGIILLGAHYDGHDVSQSAADNGAGVAVMMEAARALAPHRRHLARTVRFAGFAQEEMGLIGAEAYAEAHRHDGIAFMLNLDGTGRGGPPVLTLQGWPEAVSWFRDTAREMFASELVVGDEIGLYSDMYPFARRGIPASTMMSASPATSGAPRGYGHTAWDSLEKLDERGIQRDAALVARMVLRLASVPELPLAAKEPHEIGEVLKVRGFDEVLRYEGRPVPGDEGI